MSGPIVYTNVRAGQVFWVQENLGLTKGVLCTLIINLD